MTGQLAVVMKFVPVNMQAETKKPQSSSMMSYLTKKHYIQVAFLLGAVLILVLFRMIGRVRETFVMYHAESDTDGELFVLPNDFVSLQGAVCLDGSPPGFHIRYGKGVSRENWVIYLPGEGWCSTEEECYQRSFSTIGSSVRAPVRTTFAGLLSANPTVNPDFYTWNMVQLLYCDGGSFAGNRSEPIHYEGRPLYLRGFPVLICLLDYLLLTTRLGVAERVLFVGSSAGGLGVLIHADYIRQKLQHVHHFHIVLDATMFPDVPNLTGNHTLQSQFRQAFSLHHMNGDRGIGECTAELSVHDKWRCLFPSRLYTHLFTPAFFIASLHDSWLISNVLKVACSWPDCTAQEFSSVALLRDQVLQQSKAVQASQKDGVFLFSEPIHTAISSTFGFSRLTVKGVTMKAALGNWYRGRGRFVTIDNRTLKEVFQQSATT